MSDLPPLDSLLLPAVEHKRQLEDSDILPKCEFNLTDVKRLWYKPWMTRVTEGQCEETATWMVVIEIDACLPEHDHLVMVCNEHRDYFDHSRVEHFDCNRTGPTSDYRVVSIDRL